MASGQPKLHIRPVTFTWVHSPHEGIVTRRESEGYYHISVKCAEGGFGENKKQDNCGIKKRRRVLMMRRRFYARRNGVSGYASELQNKPAEILVFGDGGKLVFHISAVDQFVSADHLRRVEKQVF